MSGYTIVPYTIAYANEIVTDPIGFVPYAGRVRLSYMPSKPGDWVTASRGVRGMGGGSGILRARVLDLHDKPDRRGPERMRKLNTRRQWRCMDKLLCQVCGGPAFDTSGTISWALTKTVFERTGLDSGRTNSPPTCRDCIPKALQECPMLREDFAVYRVGYVTPAGVLADLYRPGVLRNLEPFGHNMFVAWDDYTHHPYALAAAQVVELHGMQPVLV
ncbi:hypothetical protein GBF35_26050 [Nonomuraea phyllanthi]|uniref:hypothetical protein n=1 Tax=Nonomuraea phyllanthi TaxID=2219224 RepID=UPI0012936325|nr:hypothetical protein [Nonomuraea phyllanthi]QFY09658.1 hypothetical protein GBF35_26050 [Nonomuraea phyllanthi]